MSGERPVSSRIPAVKERLAQAPDTGTKQYIETIDKAVLLMQREPRQVVTANNRALELFAKNLDQVAAHRGGEVFDCIHAFTVAGCGKDVNCEDCKIKEAIVDTFDTGSSHKRVQTELIVRTDSGAEQVREIQVSTEAMGELALVYIEDFGLKAGL